MGDNKFANPCKSFRRIPMSADFERKLGQYADVLIQIGLTFYNILYDENASCHMALGNAYRFSLEGGSEMTPEEFTAAGGNQSPVHLDFMMGSGELDVDGIKSDGTVEPVMRGGEWTIAV
jgi:aminopeptidase